MTINRAETWRSGGEVGGPSDASMPVVRGLWHQFGTTDRRYRVVVFSCCFLTSRLVVAGSNQTLFSFA